VLLVGICVVSEFADTPELIRAGLIKRKIKVLDRNDKHAKVLFEKKGKIQYGLLNIPFTARYGINVLCNYDGRGFWYQSRQVMSEVPQHVHELMLAAWEDPREMDVLLDLEEIIHAIEVSW
jgi:hypothetical protein